MSNDFQTIPVEEYEVIKKKLKGLEKIEEMFGKEMITLCSNCKSIQTESGKYYGTYKTIEEVLEDLFNVKISHGICIKCSNKIYPNLLQNIDSGENNE